MHNTPRTATMVGLSLGVIAGTWLGIAVGNLLLWMILGAALGVVVAEVLARQYKDR